MQTFTAIQYLAIDIANHYGLDKIEFEKRIQWVRDHQDCLERLIPEAETPLLYAKAVGAFRKALKGLPVGHAVALDSVCSGLQIMSVISGCYEGCTITGLIDPDKRYDAYTEITNTMNEILGDKQIIIDREDAKKATMTAAYGSKATPRNRIGEENLYAFYEACEKRSFGAFQLLEFLRDSWNKHQDHHTWTLPDGHVAYVPVMVSDIKRVKVEEFNYTMSVEFFTQAPTKYGISNIANAVHSIDAYILRSMVRRCSYNPKQVHTALALITEEIERRVESCESRTQWLDHPVIAQYNATQMADITAIHDLSEVLLAAMEFSHLHQLKSILKRMLKHPPFDLITIHDSFACQPNHCNQLRYWYKELLAELHESTLLQHILRQLYNSPDLVYTPDRTDLGQYIRKSNYGLC